MCCGTPGAEPRTASSDDYSHPSVIVPSNVFESHSAVGRLGHQRRLAEVVDLSRCWLSGPFGTAAVCITQNSLW